MLIAIGHNAWPMPCQHINKLDKQKSFIIHNVNDIVELIKTPCWCWCWCWWGIIIKCLYPPVKNLYWSFASHTHTYTKHKIEFIYFLLSVHSLRSSIAHMYGWAVAEHQRFQNHRTTQPNWNVMCACVCQMRTKPSRDKRTEMIDSTWRTGLVRRTYVFKCLEHRQTK